MPLVPSGWPPFAPKFGGKTGMRERVAWILVVLLVAILAWAWFGP